MARYRVLQGFCLGGGRDVYPPDVIELPEREAAPYVFEGRLEEVIEKEKPAAKEKPADEKKDDKK